MTDARFPLETACRLSRSVRWRLPRRFFRKGSVHRYGPTPAARVQLASCHDRTASPPPARLDEALALDPAHAGALELAARLAGRDAPALR